MDNSDYSVVEFYENEHNIARKHNKKERKDIISKTWLHIASSVYFQYENNIPKKIVLIQSSHFLNFNFNFFF